MSIAIFSALYGSYDAIPELPSGLTIPAIMYTDEPIDAPGWEVRVVNHGITTLLGRPERTGPMLAHKWWKLTAGRDEFDYTIWLDASMTITVDDFEERCQEAIAGHDLALMRHPWRECIYEEASFSATLHRYEAEAPHILAQAEYYRQIGHPDNAGLYASGFYIRADTMAVRALMDNWWWEIITRSHQDQVSLPVVLRLAEQVSSVVNLPWHDGPESWTHLGGHLK